MANKKTVETLAKELDFNNSTEYFDYILESVINGQRKQARDLIEAMRKGAKKTALVYFYDFSGDDVQEVKDMLIDSF